MVAPLPTPTGTFRHITDYLKDSWNLFRQYPGGFIGFTAILLGIGLVLNIIFSLFPTRSGIAIFFLLLLSWLLGALLTPLYGGFFTVPALLAQGQRPSFGDFFAGYHHFLHLFLVGLIAPLIIAAGLILFTPIGIYLGVSYLLALPLVLDRRVSFWSALEASRRAVWQNFFPILGLMVLLFTLMMFWAYAAFFSLPSLLAFWGFGQSFASRFSSSPLQGIFFIIVFIVCIGSTFLLTMPYLFSAITLVYRDLFGIQSTMFRAPRQPQYPTGWPPPPQQPSWPPPPPPPPPPGQSPS
jgi:uncharacterized membrane protein